MRFSKSLLVTKNLVFPLILTFRSLKKAFLDLIIALFACFTLLL